MANIEKSKSTKSSTQKKASSKSTSSSKKSVNSTISKTISEVTGIDKKYVSKAVNKTGKLSTGGKMAVALCFAIGIAGGYFGVRIIQRNDQFRLVNGETFSVNVGEDIDLTEIGKYVVCVSYGMDATSSVSVEGVDSLKLDTKEEKTYVVKYKSSNIKYKNIVLTQTINVVLSENSYSGE